ncbi:hypothetical protein [Nocardia australiensis]|uniref:hypothetical protein n=1 Tax=Nocardia australiensis TaxID=2887191 RepID=UPI001D136AB3|nr:hypothetical protein [Nocardia australiensis]
MSDVEKWRNLAEQARGGELYLDDEVAARECFAACAQRIDALDLLAERVQQAESVSGFGNFEMAKALEAKFRTQASGTGNSLAEVIAENVETVKNMREVMAISFKRITGQDIENAAPIANATDQVG